MTEQGDEPATTTPATDDPAPGAPPSAPAPPIFLGYGNLVLRALAWALDFLLSSLVAYPVRYGIFTLLAYELVALDFDIRSPAIGIPWQIGGLFLDGAIRASYNALLIASPLQATPGKIFCRLKVVDRQGRRLDPLQAFAREFCKYLSAFPLGAGFVMAAFDPHRRALHDQVAGTLVVRSREPRPGTALSARIFFRASRRADHA